MANVSVIIPAAGTGTRMGAGVPKPFLELEGVTILQRTLSRFNKPSVVLEIIIAVSPQWEEKVRDIAEKSGLDVPVVVVKGGSERMFSIYNGLQQVSGAAEYVAIHDAVRPFFTDELFDDLMKHVQMSGAVIPGLPVTDTIKIIDMNNNVVGSPDRNQLRAAQTPQLFKKELLTKAYNKAVDDQVIGTDDASIMEHSGYAVMLIDGEADNFKITYPADIQRADELIKRNQL
jgi:2-C-methyl-D-erythritol 4-phosphate cytidylyltransferase